MTPGNPVELYQRGSCYGMTTPVGHVHITDIGTGGNVNIP